MIESAKITVAVDGGMIEARRIASKKPGKARKASIARLKTASAEAGASAEALPIMNPAESVMSVTAAAVEIEIAAPSRMRNARSFPYGSVPS